MVTCIAPIVEGHGDALAVPILIRRLAVELSPNIQVRIEQPIRRGRHALVRSGQLERDVEVAARLAGRGGAVLIVIDSDGEPPCILGPRLLTRAQAVRSDMPLGVVLAHQEFEAWFLAAAGSLRGLRGLPEDLEPPPEPEGVRGAKEWLTRHMPQGRSYSETLDQPALTAQFDLGLARRTGSFDKCYREVIRLLQST